jgi:hypothetical protein
MTIKFGSIFHDNDKPWADARAISDSIAVAASKIARILENAALRFKINNPR